MILSRWIMAFALAVGGVSGAVALAQAQSNGGAAKGGEDLSGPYEVVPGWPKLLHNDGWGWGSVAGVWAESPDRVFVFQRGELDLPKNANQMADGALPARPAATSGKPRMEHILLVFDRNGNLVESWDQWNKVFVHPHRILFNPYDKEHHVWLVDDGGHQIFEFTHDGKQLLLTLGEKEVPGNDHSHFNRPTDIAWLPNGDFYVTDGYVNTRVVKFSKDGKYLFEWGKPGKGPGKFNLVHAIVIDPRGRLLVSDRSNSRIQIFDQNGKYLDEWDNIQSPFYLYLSQDQHLWVSDGYTSKFLEYNLEGKLLSSWGTFGTDPGKIWGPHQFSIDSEGNLYVAEVFNGRVQKFRPKKGANQALLMKP
jgi:6-bladed beta-propeller protein